MYGSLDRNKYNTYLLSKYTKIMCQTHNQYYFLFSWLHSGMPVNISQCFCKILAINIFLFNQNYRSSQSFAKKFFCSLFSPLMNKNTENYTGLYYTILGVSKSYKKIRLFFLKSLAFSKKATKIQQDRQPLSLRYTKH